MKKILLGVLLAAVVFAPLHLPTQTNAFPNQDKHHAMLRLEDVGPGGSYETLDDLGKLRAIFEYLESQHVPFHVATIPRSKHIQPDGTWYEKGIDDPNPDDTVKAFINLLRDAQDHGAVLGMHGYTHQYGDAKRSDHNQDSGTGFEFNVKGADETLTPEYASDKIQKSLAAFYKVGFVPGFWESPHYNDTREQEEVFRSYMGVLYQPDFRSLRSFKDMTMYETENTFGSPTLGSAYIPAPLKYITDAASVTNVLNRLDTYRGLGAMYYHPFLEFPFLEPVLGKDGKPVVRDGLPEYRYKSGAPSNLHRLVDGFRERGFQWESIYDVLPYTPAHRVELPLGTEAHDLLLGHVSGSRSTDVVVRDQNRIQVFTGNYEWPRNRTQPAGREWLKTTFAPSEQFLLGDADSDGLDDLLAYDKANGTLRLFRSNGSKFEDARAIGTLPGGFDLVAMADLNADRHADLLMRRGDELWSVWNSNGRFADARKVTSLPHDAIVRCGDFNGDKRDDVLVYSPELREIRIYSLTSNNNASWDEIGHTAVPHSEKTTQLLTGDVNGDGLTDVTMYDPESGIWQELDNTGSANLKPHDNLYGPWASGEHTAFAADFDGNGRSDIAAFDPVHHTLDLSLSFRSKTPQP
ncbi:DUF2334 domain-containing protein [Tumebacillus flagellatus]|uniref:DUF2334 domain-containing protein n=1 Tax=Tumebacillus flagellatus TaxID=1157490 RepID=A0A074LR38_9BACL|nr:DUF2334 domain-containing protein [Tumebacillus flagellatus]KEO84581.1 hypothetical protein EL26_03430 [Tumebacillus flagellatus]